MSMTLIYCDIDDTLLDSKNIMLEAYVQAGLDIEEASTLIYSGIHFDTMFPGKEDVHAVKEEIYESMLVGTPNRGLFSINTDLVKKIQDVWKLSSSSVMLVTTGSHRSTLAKLKILGMEDVLFLCNARKTSSSFWAFLKPGVVMDDNDAVLAAAIISGHRGVKIEMENSKCM